MLRDDEAGQRLQNLSRAKKRTILEFLCAHRYLACGNSDSDQVVRAALHVDGGDHGAHSQRDAQRGRRLGGPYGDGNFFGFKTGIGNDEPIIACREPGDHESAVRVRLCCFEHSTVRAANLHGGSGNHRARRINDGSRNGGETICGEPARASKPRQKAASRPSWHTNIIFLLRMATT